MKKLREKKSKVIIAGVALLFVLVALAIAGLVYVLLRPTRRPNHPDFVWPPQPPQPPINDWENIVTAFPFPGSVRGRRETTVSLGKSYMSFKGMPYAIAPLRELRFKVNLEIFTIENKEF